MKKVIEYTICKSNDIESLTQMVSKLLTQGWQPLGGVGANDIRYLQAMVKYADN